MAHKSFPVAKALLLCTTFSALSQAQDIELDELLLQSSELLKRGQAEQALELLVNYQELFSNSAEYQNNLAVTYLGNNEPERALRILRELVEDDPLFSIIGHNLIELEKGAAGLETDQVNPILFVQSVDSFSSGNDIPSDSNLRPTNNLLTQALRSSLQSWADAWSSKDFQRYINHYASRFQPENAMPLEVWRQGREVRLEKPGDINVTISNLAFFPEGDQPRVVFDQEYSSATYADRTQKEIIFVQDNNLWKISSERTIKTY